MINHSTQSATMLKYSSPMQDFSGTAEGFRKKKKRKEKALLIIIVFFLKILSPCVTR